MASKCWVWLQISLHLERAAKDLELLATPALDALALKVIGAAVLAFSNSHAFSRDHRTPMQVDTHNLERERRVKTRLVRLKTKVETVRRHTRRNASTLLSCYTCSVIVTCNRLSRAFTALHRFARC